MQRIEFADGTVWGLPEINARTLQSTAAADILRGTLTADTINGGLGNDTISATAGNTDVALFGSAISTDQLWFRQVANTLEVSIIDTADMFTISNWYLGNQYHLEQFKTSDGKTLLDSKVQNLVQAMASFSPPVTGQTTLPPAYASQLNSMIAANWQ